MITGQTITKGIFDVMSLNSSATNSKPESQSGSQKDKVSFDQILVSQTASARTAKFNTNQKQYTSGKTNAATNDKADSLKKTDNGKSSALSKKDYSKKTDKTIRSSRSARTNNSEKTDQNSKADDKLQAMAEDMREEIKDTLDISDEQLTQMMESLGMTMLDLLNPEALKQLVMLDAGTNDLMSLATDENLHQTLDSLLNQLSQITESVQSGEDMLSMAITEDAISEAVSDAEELTDAQSGSNDVKAQSSENEDNGNASESKISLTVTKESEDGSASDQNYQSQSNSQHQESVTTASQTNQFVEQLVSQPVSMNEGFDEFVSVAEQMKEITNQIVEQIKVVIRPTQTAMEMTLNPEHLGKIALHISSKAGVLTATFTAQTEAAREAIESNLNVLKNNLENQGIKVEAIEVNVSNFNFDNNNAMSQESSAQQEASKQKNRPIRMQAEDLVDDLSADETTEDILSDSSSINYTA